MVKPHFSYRNYIFLLCLEEKTDENIKNLNKEIKLVWDSSMPLGHYLDYEIENMYEDDNFLYTNNNVKLVIMAQEVSFLEKNNQIKKINNKKTYKIKECVICLTNPPNVLFCDCGHICLCEKCSEMKRFDKCPICKTKKTILRIIE